MGLCAMCASINASNSAALEPNVRKRVTSLTSASIAMRRVVAPRKPCWAYTRFAASRIRSRMSMAGILRQALAWMQVPTYFYGSQSARVPTSRERQKAKGPGAERAKVRRYQRPMPPKRREGRQARVGITPIRSRRPIDRSAISPLGLLRSFAPRLLRSWASSLSLRSSPLGLRRYGFFAVESVVAAPASFDWIDCAFSRCAWIVGCAFVISALSDVSCAAVLAVCSRFSTDW